MNPSVSTSNKENRNFNFSSYVALMQIPEISDGLTHAGCEFSLTHETILVLIEAVEKSLAPESLKNKRSALTGRAKNCKKTLRLMPGSAGSHLHIILQKSIERTLCSSLFTRSLESLTIHVIIRLVEERTNVV